MRFKTVWFLFLLFTSGAFQSYAQEFTLRTTSENTARNRVEIDLPGLNGNPLAIIVVTPLGNTKTLNPNPIGAWYYADKWNINNTDGAKIVAGLTYKIQYFPKPDTNQFLHIVTKENLGDEGSFIDHPSLNNNPNAQLNILQNHAPSHRRNYNLNRFEAKAVYNSASGKWHIANANGSPLYPNTAYNIVISSDGLMAPAVPRPSTQVPPITSASPAPKAAPASSELLNSKILIPPLMPTASTTRTAPLTFGNLNDFAAKGLPSSATLPTENLDQAAVIMAQEISKSDERSLPVLLAALQTAGFTVIDENGKALLKPANGKGQGLGFYDFEAVGALKLANRGITVSLEKIGATITKDAPQISASQLAELMLKDLRTQAENSENAYLRFYARLIIELGRSSPQPIDLMTSPASQVNLSVLQATLLTRRLQGAIYTLKTKFKKTGIIRPRFSQRDSFVSALWEKNELPYFIPVSLSAIQKSPCNLTGDEALILDAAAVELTAWNGWQIGLLGPAKDAAGGYYTTLGKIGLGLQGAGAALAWLKLVAAVTMMKGEITVQKPLPLIRTKNSNTQEPSNKRLMTARVWSEVGRLEMLNCVRPLINAATGLDFNLPTNGPLADVAIEWHFTGENEIRVNNAETRNLQNFANFKAPEGADANPQKQVTDNLGLSKMWLVGAPKVPAVAYQKNPMKIEKQANVLVAVKLKSAKDVKQNWIDMLGAVVGVGTGGPLGFIAAAAEIGYRLPYVAARATIPVIDHEPCDGQWQGTITYTRITTSKLNTTITPGNPRPRASGDGGTGNSETTVTQSGTVTVNGNEWMADSSVDQITTNSESSTGKHECSRKGMMGQLPPLVSWSEQRSVITSGGGNAQGRTTGGISLYKDNYTISITPLAVNGTLRSTTQTSSKGGCSSAGPSPSQSSSQAWRFGSNDPIGGSGNYGDDRNILSGSSTKTVTTPSSNSPSAIPQDRRLPTRTTTGGTSVTTTITWNLRRCE